MNLKEYIQSEIKSVLTEDYDLDQAFNDAQPVEEGVMSELDILAKEAKDLKSFVKTVFKEFDNLPKNKETLKWLEGIYKDSTNESVNENAVDKLRTAVQKINQKYQVKVSTHPVTKGEIEIILGRGNHSDSVYHSIEKLVSKLGIKRGDYSIFDESVKIDELRLTSYGVKALLKAVNNRLDLLPKLGFDKFKDVIHHLKYGDQEEQNELRDKLKQLGVNVAYESVNEFNTSVNKRRAGAELKQKLKGKRSDGMGKYTGTIYGLDSNGKRVELKSLNDLNKYSEFELGESVNEAQKINPTSMKFLKGMKKIKVKGLGGYMPGVDYVYVDGDKYYFVDFEGDHMELNNTNTIKQ
jgi:hypothetical protein